MIAGTITFEGMAVTFCHIHGGVDVTIQDALTGGTARINVSLGEWAATLALMIGGDGGELEPAEELLYKLAERAQPTREHLIDCREEDGEEEVRVAVNAVRLIP